jgi:hypothetical protein
MWKLIVELNSLATTALWNSIYHLFFAITSSLTSISSLYYPNVRIPLTVNGWVESFVLFGKNEIDRVQTLLLQTLVFTDSVVTNFKNGVVLLSHYVTTAHLGTLNKVLINFADLLNLSQTSNLTPQLALGVKVNYDATLGHLIDILVSAYYSLTLYVKSWNWDSDNTLFFKNSLESKTSFGTSVFDQTIQTILNFFFSR